MKTVLRCSTRFNILFLQTFRFPLYNSRWLKVLKNLVETQNNFAFHHVIPSNYSYQENNLIEMFEIVLFLFIYFPSALFNSVYFSRYFIFSFFH